MVCAAVGEGGKGRITVEVRTTVSRAIITHDSPSAHPTREECWLKQHRVGEGRGELGADFTTFYWPRIARSLRDWQHEGEKKYEVEFLGSYLVHFY